MAAYIAGRAGEVDEHGHRRVVRNGSHAAREVVTAAGAVPVTRAGSRRIPTPTTPSIVMSPFVG